MSARSLSRSRGRSGIVYFTILITHTVLAAAIVPLALITLSRGLRARYDRHRAHRALDDCRSGSTFRSPASSCTSCSIADLAIVQCVGCRAHALVARELATRRHAAVSCNPRLLAGSRSRARHRARARCSCSTSTAGGCSSCGGCRGGSCSAASMFLAVAPYVNRAARLDGLRHLAVPRRSSARWCSSSPPTPTGSGRGCGARLRARAAAGRDLVHAGAGRARAATRVFAPGHVLIAGGCSRRPARPTCCSCADPACSARRSSA